jgi:hypothetical protein
MVGNPVLLLPWIPLSIILGTTLSPTVGWPAPYPNPQEANLDQLERLIARTSSLIGQADRMLAQAEQPPDAKDGPTATTPAEPAPAIKSEPPPQQQKPAEPPPAPASPSAEEAQKGQPAAAASAVAPKEQEEEREVSRVPLAAVQAGGLLLPRDSLIIEPSMFYTYSANTRLIVTGFSVLPLIILGTLQSERVTTSLVTPALQFRYGLYRALQLDFRIPYTYANTSLLRVSSDQAGQVEESQHDMGLGDINFGLTYQFLYERGWLPDLMFRVGASVPTGKSQFDIFEQIAQSGALVSAEAFLHALNTSGIALGAGRWNFQTAFNAVKALDPGILFATLGWNYTPPSTENLIQITSSPVSGGVLLSPQLIAADLGAVHSFLVSAGLAISLNNQLSVNFSVSELLSRSTTANGVKIPGSATNIGQFNFGLNLAISPTTTLNFLTQIGITPDSPSLLVLASVPVFYNNVAENTYGYLKGKISDLLYGKPAVIEKPVEKKEPTSSNK